LLFCFTFITQHAEDATELGLRQQLHWPPVPPTHQLQTGSRHLQDQKTSTPTNLSHLIHDYSPGRCLRSADKLLFIDVRTLLALSAEAFSVSALTVWNSLSLSHLTVGLDSVNYTAHYFCPYVKDGTVRHCLQ